MRTRGSCPSRLERLPGTGSCDAADVLGLRCVQSAQDAGPTLAEIHRILASEGIGCGGLRG